MAKDSDQRSYSVDEMMEQLKKGDREKRRSEEAELVTRPDGSQVMRVRRRKRRSNQPAKVEERKKRRYGIFVLIGLIVVALGVGAAVLVLVAKFNSKGFREEFEQSLSSASTAKVGVSDFSVTPFSSQAGAVQFAWSPGGLPKSLTLEKLKGDVRVSSFVGSGLKGHEIVAQKDKK